MPPTIPTGAAGAAAALNPYVGIGLAGIGALSTIGGAIGLMTSEKPKGYELTPRMSQAIRESETAAGFGLGQQQIALAQQQQREAQNTQLLNARNLSGGSLSRALFGANTFSRLMAGNQLAAQDFAAMEGKRKYRDAMYGQEQDIANRVVATNLQQYAQEQTTSGGALQSGLYNLGSYFNYRTALMDGTTTSKT